MPIVITERFAEAYTKLPRHIQKKSDGVGNPARVYTSPAYDDQSLEHIESFVG
jgi:hypothetical protein